MENPMITQTGVIFLIAWALTVDIIFLIFFFLFFFLETPLASIIHSNYLHGCPSPFIFKHGFGPSTDLSLSGSSKFHQFLGALNNLNVIASTQFFFRWMMKMLSMTLRKRALSLWFPPQSFSFSGMKKLRELKGSKTYIQYQVEFTSGRGRLSCASNGLPTSTGPANQASDIVVSAICNNFASNWNYSAVSNLLNL